MYIVYMMYGCVVCRVREYKERQKHHEKLNKPASKQQFEEVWEEDDGLKDEEFDPKTFFFLHGNNVLYCKLHMHVYKMYTWCMCVYMIVHV